MAELDLLLRGGAAVTSDGPKLLDIGIAGGRIVALAPDLHESAREEINTAGLHIFPGLIDSHVHFNEPGRTEWEGFVTGTRALAAGGGTLFFDMPLNAHPPTIDAGSFDLKLAAARAGSLVDFAFWGGLVPGNVHRLEELAARGVIGFKAFMANSGIDDFSCVDDHTLRAGMKEAARLKRLVAVHAESENITRELAEQCARSGRTAIRDFLDSRPIAAELDATRRAVDIAGETGCSLHVVHVSCGEGVAMIDSARRAGVDVTCETCPHYLTLTEDDMVGLGAVAKCAPPLRTKSAQDELWQQLRSGHISTIGSDHSPSPPDMKRDSNFFKVWGGISSVQHTLPLLITEGHLHRGVDLSVLTRMISSNVAARFDLGPGKGRLALGADADLAFVDLRKEFTVEREGLFYHHKQSPYVGRTLKGRVVRTMVRGRTVFKDGKIVAECVGTLVRPSDRDED